MSKATILLAAYKGNDYAGAMIDSILAQDCDNWELVLSDDGGFTEDLLAGYAEKYPDRITLHRSGLRFGSAQKHFLYLMKLCRNAEYLMFCDQDDVWHPDKVRKTLAAMQAAEQAAREESRSENAPPVLVHTDLRVADGELRTIDESFMHYSRLDGTRLKLNELLIQNVVTGCTLMINRPLTALALEGAEEEKMLMHDWWIALCAAAFGRSVFLPEATIDYRQHGGNVVGAKSPLNPAYLKSRLSGGAIRKSLDDTSAQAEAFLKVYGERLDAAQKETVEAFAKLPETGKLARLRTYSRYGFWKKDPGRRLAQMIWG
ncbi:MAG: glycosyltransferase family 2 protein [Lachnospiraceae bacterium]|nr:glycosyltransferase family 2 protein [Lachnospiraceae bacterium]